MDHSDENRARLLGLFRALAEVAGPGGFHRLEPETATLALTSIASAATGRKVPIVESGDTAYVVSFIRFTITALGNDVEVRLSDDLSLKVRIPEFVGELDRRLAWIAYIVIRYAVKPIKNSLLEKRLIRSGVHYRARPADVEIALALASSLSNNTIKDTMRSRALWWSQFCNALDPVQTNGAEELRKFLRNLVSRRNTRAWLFFREKGGHAGSLDGSEYEDLEPVLFSTPVDVNGLYISTLHMLKEIINDGSVFSEEDA